MSIFGWSYPAGCSGTPFDEEQWCTVCGQGECSCICEACPVCDEAGNEACYDTEGHGMEYSEAQEQGYDEAMRAFATPAIYPETWHYLELEENA